MAELQSSAALSAAARSHDLSAVHAALVLATSAPNDIAIKGKTALMLAAQVAGTDACQVVLALLATGEIGCGLNGRDAKGRTALMLAARCGSGLVLQALIEAGAELELVCARGESAWAKAQAGGHADASSVLEAAGARSGRVMGTGTGSSTPVLARFPMPSAQGCDATRFNRQYRGRMTVCLPGLVAKWPACAAWRTDRARLADRMGGAASLVPVLRANVDGVGGARSVPADVRALADGSAVPVSECLSRCLDASGGSEEAQEGCEAAICEAFTCKLPLTAALLSDLGAVPHSLFGAPSVAKAGEKHLWLSARGSHTPLHFDHCHAVICQVTGRKRVTVFAPCDSPHVYPFSMADGNVRTSRVDLWTWRFGSTGARAVERHKHPGVAAATPFECVLSPGDCIYIPPGWWHMAEAIDGSISVLLPFDMSEREQKATDRPWTRPGWGAYSLPTAAAPAEAEAEAEASPELATLPASARTAKEEGKPSVETCAASPPDWDALAQEGDVTWQLAAHGARAARELVVRTSSRGGSTGSRIWSSSHVLFRHLQASGALSDPKAVVLELGSGTGFRKHRTARDRGKEPAHRTPPPPSCTLAPSLSLIPLAASRRLL